MQGLTFVVRKQRGIRPLRIPSILLCLALAACGAYPRDVEGTLDEIERSHVVRVGFTDLSGRDRGRAEAFVARLERATGAQATIDLGPTESQLARLEIDELDLVIGAFAQDTPWAKDVAVLEPLSWRRVGGHVIGLSVVAANGENRWIALLEREIRDHAEDAR